MDAVYTWMVRGAVLAALIVVGCYRPPADRCVACGPAGECPAATPCDRGYCGGPDSCSPAPDEDARQTDGSDISSCDTVGSFGPPAPVFQPMADTVATYTASASGMVAFKYEPSTIGIGALDGNDFTAAISDGQLRNRAPVISPEGDEIFVHRQQPGGEGPYDLAVSYRNASSWSVPTAISILDLAMEVPIGNSDLPGTPTALAAGARRMVYESTQGLVEIEEMVRGTWRKLTIYTPGSLQAVDKITDPQLSQDGKRLVFVADGEVRLAVRASRAEPFVATGILVSGAFAHPFLTADCTRLYAHDPTRNSIVRFDAN